MLYIVSFACVGIFITRSVNCNKDVDDDEKMQHINVSSKARFKMNFKVGKSWYQVVPTKHKPTVATTLTYNAESNRKGGLLTPTTAHVVHLSVVRQGLRTTAFMVWLIRCAALTQVAPTATSGQLFQRSSQANF